MTIREYFSRLYDATSAETFDDIVEYEYAVFQMDDRELSAWAEDHGVDLWARDETGILYLTRWMWDWDDLEENFED